MPAIINKIYLNKKCNSFNEDMKAFKTSLKRLTTDIEKVLDILIQTQSKSLVTHLEALEKQKEETEYQLERMKSASRQIKVTQTEMKRVFALIRKLIKSVDSSNLRQVVDLYVDRIEVYPEKVIVKLNFFPTIHLDMEKEDCGEYAEKQAQKVTEDSPSGLSSVENGGEGTDETALSHYEKFLDLLRITGQRSTVKNYHENSYLMATYLSFSTVTVI